MRRNVAIVVGCLAFFLGSIVACGGSALVAFFLMLFFAPSMLVWLVVEDHPLAVAQPVADPYTSELIQQRIWSELALLGTTTVSSGDLQTMTAAAQDPSMPVFLATVDPQDRIVFDLSVQPDVTTMQYVNVHMIGRFTMERGWFTSMTVDECQFSGWDLAAWGQLPGQELAQHANRSLADQRSQDPGLGPKLDGVERMTVENGGISITLNPGGQAAWGLTPTGLPF